jgi:phenylalanyl-tRNA synthetase beta chain
MKVSLNWLRELLALELDTAAICERLTMGGLEVEGVTQVGAEIASVVVAEVCGTEPHPNADQLTVCRVRSGGGEPATVVCGARNMRVGDRVAYAPPGAELPGERRIETAAIRGVTSAGMLCSAEELGLPGDGDGILILAADAAIGAPLIAHLGIEDVVLEIAVTPNRGDCLSILGIARELAALSGARLRRHRARLRERGEATAAQIAVRIDDAAACRRYAARIVRGVRIAPSPPQVQQRLSAVGLRPINNVVDVTNLVMIERGQPLHAFDLARLARPEIVVRRAGASAAMQTLDGVVRGLEADDLVISTGDEAIAIAGVMGGADSQVGEATTDVLLESAWFDPSCVRRTARRLDLHSEAAYRFERGVDIGGVDAALERAAELLQQWAGGSVAVGSVDCYPGRQPAEAIALRPARVEALLGCPLGRGEVRRTLRALGAEVASGPGGTLAVVAPSFRYDLQREIDLIEEVARVLGYDRIPASMPSGSLSGANAPERQRLEREIRSLLRAAGLFEVVGLSFVAPRANQLFPGLRAGGAAVELMNPVNRDEGEMRRSLLTTLVAFWRHNRNHGAAAIAGFSLGKVYWRTDTPGEGWRLAGVLAGQVPRLGLAESRAPVFADAKGVVETVLAHLDLDRRVEWRRDAGAASLHPGKSALLLLDGAPLGVIGALHPDVEAELGVEEAHWLFEVDLEALVRHSPPQHVFRGLPRFPAVARDLALVADERFPADRVVRFVRDWNRDLVEDITLFDEYVGAPIAPGKKSLAYSIAYRAPNRTLTDEEVNALQDQLTEALTSELHVEPRR